MWLLSRHESFEYFLRFFRRACGVCAFLASSGSHVVAPHLSCLPSRFTLVRSLYWVLGLSGVSPGCCCVGSACTVDYRSGSSAGLAQCWRCGGFFPSFALVWGLLFFLRNFASIPRLRFWCSLFCSVCLFSASLSPTVARLVCFSCGPPSLVVPVGTLVSSWMDLTPLSLASLRALSLRVCCQVVLAVSVSFGCP